MTRIHHATIAKARDHGLRIITQQGGFAVIDEHEKVVVSDNSDTKPKDLLNRAIQKKAGVDSETIEQMKENIKDKLSEDATEVVRRSVVKQIYRDEYKARGDATCCGDDLSQILKSATTDDAGKLSKQLLYAIGKQNSIDVSERFGHLNPGQQRMCMSNMLRSALRKGLAIRIGEVTYAAEDLEIEVKE